MAKCVVTKIVHNAKGPGKNGTYNGTLLSTESEKGAKRTDFIFASREAGDQGSVVAELAVGDKVELKIEKKGDYFNLSRDKDAIKLIEKGNGSVPEKTSSGSTGGGSRSYGAKSPEEQASIVKQVAFKGAIELISTMISKDLYKKNESNADQLSNEIMRISDRFNLYLTGKVDGNGVNPVEQAEVPPPSSPDIPFDIK